MGERLYYAASWRGRWLAVLVFCAAARHLRHREKWIGWTEAQRRNRLSRVTNNARFLILPHWRLPNRASKVMGACLQRLPQDWQARYGHAVCVAESFVDTQLFQGTAYKASGWTELGATQGYSRCAQDYYVKHKRPKARRSLCAEHLPEPVAAVVESSVPPRPNQRVGVLRSLRVEAALLDWQRQVLGPAPEDQLLAADGKALHQTLAQRLPQAPPLFFLPEPLPANWARTVEKNRGRQETRTLCVAAIDPEQA